ncbi:unnamed protein product [Toxocara canis]|uniref:Uncharacterized protein n=1 Tax=Toxocara canis TaxID=6265 RepID=A0A183UU43_TOXCA|nr:unnamed protein product [Toxocara canis]
MRSWHALKPMNEDLRRKQLTVVASTYGYPVILRTQSLNKPRYGNHYYLIVDLRARFAYAICHILHSLSFFIVDLC